MTDDRDIEALLRRYRVSDLPRRPLPAQARRRRDDTWWWGPAAAAAVLAMWLCAHGLSESGTMDPEREAAVAAIAAAMGGGDDARRYAALAVEQFERTQAEQREEEPSW
jgi:hypothetical protein